MITNTYKIKIFAIFSKYYSHGPISSNCMVTMISSNGMKI